MLPIANAMSPAVGMNGVVVESVKTRQIVEQMASKPGERFGTAQSADGDLEIVTAPAAPRSPGCGQAFAQQVREPPLPQHVVPELGQHRREWPGTQPGVGARHEAAEKFFIQNAPLFIRNIGLQTVERELPARRRPGAATGPCRYR